jgi:hypothetical protein
VRMTRFWNNIHQVRSSQNIAKPNNLQVFGSITTKGPKQNQLRSPMTVRRETWFYE